MNEREIVVPRVYGTLEMPPLTTEESKQLEEYVSRLHKLLLLDGICLQQMVQPDFVIGGNDESVP